MYIDENHSTITLYKLLDTFILPIVKHRMYRYTGSMLTHEVYSSVHDELALLQDAINDILHCPLYQLNIISCFSNELDIKIGFKNRAEDRWLTEDDLLNITIGNSLAMVSELQELDAYTP